MNDGELRESAARALGWRRLPSSIKDPLGISLPPLDWTTAGALLEMCAKQGVKNPVYLGGAYVFVNDADVEEVEWSGDITARNVIEACVMALGGDSNGGC